MPCAELTIRLQASNLSLSNCTFRRPISSPPFSLTHLVLPPLPAAVDLFDALRTPSITSLRLGEGSWWPRDDLDIVNLDYYRRALPSLLIVAPHLTSLELKIDTFHLSQEVFIPAAPRVEVLRPFLRACTNLTHFTSLGADDTSLQHLPSPLQHLTVLLSDPWKLVEDLRAADMDWIVQQLRSSFPAVRTLETLVIFGSTSLRKSHSVWAKLSEECKRRNIRLRMARGGVELNQFARGKRELGVPNWSLPRRDLVSANNERRKGFEQFDSPDPSSLPCQPLHPQQLTTSPSSAYPSSLFTPHALLSTTPSFSLRPFWIRAGRSSGCGAGLRLEQRAMRES